MSAETCLHEPPIVEDVLAVGEVGILVEKQRPGNARHVTLGVLVAQPTEIPPGAAAEVAAGAMRENPAVAGKTGRDGNRLAGHRASGLTDHFSRQHVARHDEPFLRPDLAGLPIVTRLRLADASHGKVQGHEYGGHQFVVAFRFRVLEPTFDDHVVAGAIQRLSKVGQDLGTSEETHVMLPTIDKSCQGLRPADCAEGGKKTAILGAKVLLGQQQRCGTRRWRLRHLAPGYATMRQWQRRAILNP